LKTRGRSCLSIQHFVNNDKGDGYKKTCKTFDCKINSISKYKTEHKDILTLHYSKENKKMATNAHNDNLNHSGINLVRTNDDIYDAVKKWEINRSDTLQKYGHIGEWDVSRVTDMSWLFMNSLYFDDDISKWDVSNVINMRGMFDHAKKFDQPIGGWNVGNVTNMNKMFNHADSFNQPIGEWNVDNVTSMRGIFDSAHYSKMSMTLDWNVPDMVFL